MFKLFFKAKKYYFCGQYRNFYLESLKSRSLIEIAGAECKSFIQGLITNDIYSIGNSHGSIYSLFLNAKGRVLFDVVLYGNVKGSSGEQVFIDCDTVVVDKLIKHLTVYKLRKKIEINRVVNAGIFVVMPENESENLESLKSTHVTNDKLVYFGSDPRIKSWLLRCVGLDQSVGSIVPAVKAAPNNWFEESRLRQGICEGAREFPVGVALPLEHNGDILGGISFNKGCYIGQELTARTHHTGVVRKRVMPVQFDRASYGRLRDLLASDVTATAAADDAAVAVNLRDGHGKTVGQLRSVNRAGLGLAVVRLSSLQSLSTEGSRKFAPIKVEATNDEIVVHAPDWWPLDVLGPSMSK